MFLEIPTRFRLPAYEKIALRFIFQRPSKDLVRHSSSGTFIACVRYGIQSQDFLVCLHTDRREHLSFRKDDHTLLAFVANAR